MSIAKLKVKTRVRHYLEVGEREFPIGHKVESSDVVIKELPNGYVVVGYLVYDGDCGNPLEDCDEMGMVYSSHKNAGKDQHQSMQEALGLDQYWQPRLSCEAEAEVDRRFKDKHGDAAADSIGPGQEDEMDKIAKEVWSEWRKSGKIGSQYAIMLDCYSHSGDVWAVSGSARANSFPDRRWDVGAGAGVWVPDDGLIGYLMDLPEEKRQAQAVVYAEEALEEYNSWLAGDCYGVCTAVFNKANERVEEDSCWGYVGRKWSEQERDENVAGLVKEYEVKTG